MFISIDPSGFVTSISDTAFSVAGERTMEVPSQPKSRWDGLIGTKFINGGLKVKVESKPANELRVAIICNWNDKCGISTYSGYLVGAIRPKVKEVKVFSEIVDKKTAEDEDFVESSWTRGHSMEKTIKSVLDWKPDYVIIQHEFGIFPNARHFFKMIQMLDRTPYALVMHSVYEHLDKAVYASISKNIIVHSDAASQVLQKLGNTSNVQVIPHGCKTFEEVSELWNILHTPYSILQFGFGFKYKGVERALEALSILKNRNPEKYKDLFYTFLLSSNPHSDRVHDEYYESILEQIEKLGLQENAVVLRKYNSEETLILFLRLFKVAVFPYLVTEDNRVYGATGAARLAMATGTPTVVSESHLFDDLTGVSPRPSSAEELADELGKLFNDSRYRDDMISTQSKYVNETTWDRVADMYLEARNNLVI